MVTTLIKLACVEYKYYPVSLNAFQLIDSFLHIKYHVKIVALMMLVPTEATTEEKTNTCMDQCHPMYHWRPQIISNNWIHASRHINRDCEEETGKSWKGRGHWLTDVCMNCDWTWTGKAVVMQCPVSFKFSMSHTLQFGKTWDFSHLKITTNK